MSDNATEDVLDLAHTIAVPVMTGGKIFLS